MLQSQSSDSRLINFKQAALKGLSVNVLLFVAAMMILAAMSMSKFYGSYSFYGVLMLTPATIVGAIGVWRTRTQAETGPITANRNAVLIVLVCVVLHCVGMVYVLHVRSAGFMDVYTFQRDAAAAMSHGINPFTITQENMYGEGTIYYAQSEVVNGRVQVGFPYPPVSLLYIMPAYWLGDVRYAFVIAIAGSAIFIVLTRPDFVGAAFACLLLFNPISLFIERWGWTEPFVLLTLAFTVYAAFRNRKLLPVALGIFLVSKQYNVLAFPFIPFLLGRSDWKSSIKLLWQSSAVAALVTLPFFAWNPRAFWHDIVLFELHQPFRQDALSLAVFHPIPLAVVLLLTIGAMGWCLFTSKRHPAMFAGCYGFVLMVFVCTNKQAFGNYYFLILNSLLLACAFVALPYVDRAARQIPSQRLEKSTSETKSLSSITHE